MTAFLHQIYQMLANFRRRSRSKICRVLGFFYGMEISRQIQRDFLAEGRIAMFFLAQRQPYFPNSLQKGFEKKKEIGS